MPGLYASLRASGRTVRQMQGKKERKWQDYQCELRKSNIRNAGSDRKETVGPVLSGKQNPFGRKLWVQSFLPILPES